MARDACRSLERKNVHEIEVSRSNNALPNSESTQPVSDYVFLGPIAATPLSMNAHSISCREKALLEVSLLLGPEGRQVNAFSKIDSGLETNILPKFLKDVVHHGWPEYLNECAQDFMEFWNFREDLSVENGLVLKRHHFVIPSRLCPQMLQIIHQGHMGTENCLLKAKESLFWPSISRDKKELTANCAMSTILQKAAKRNAMCSQCAQFSVAEAWLRFV